MLSNCLTKVPNLQRLGETRTFFRVLGADEVLQRVDRTWSDSPTGKSSGQVRLDDCGGFALDLCVKCKQK